MLVLSFFHWGKKYVYWIIKFPCFLFNLPIFFYLMLHFIYKAHEILEDHNRLISDLGNDFIVGNSKIFLVDI